MKVEDNLEAAKIILVQSPLSNPGPNPIRQFQRGACPVSLGTVLPHVDVVLPKSIMQ